MRYERKYRIEHAHPQVVQVVIRQHPAGFRPLFPPRQINNLYFDTPDFAAFQDNVTGTPQRLKYRLRWYREILGKGLDLQPVLFNTYQRSYWGAPALPFRLTMDTGLRFGPYQAHREPALPFTDSATVIEVKYDQQEDERTAFILQHLPFRLSKNSKFVTGINLCYG